MVNPILTCLSAARLVTMCQAEAADRMVAQRKRQWRPEAFRTNYSFCRDTNTSRRHGIQPKSSARAGGALSLQSTCQTFTRLFIQMCIILKACVFNLVSVFASLGYTPTLLMTPVPCNFFSVANSDYRVGVELGATHHLLQLLFCARRL